MPTYTSQYPTQDDDHVKATTKLTTNYWAYFATDPAKSLTGTRSGNCWLSEDVGGIEQRFHVDLGSAKIIRRIYYENHHDSGGDTDKGVQNFTFWGSNTGVGTFDDLVWGNDEGWTELTVAQNTFDEHDTGDNPDPNYIIVTNSTAYRYYAFKFIDCYGPTHIAVRHIALQTEDDWTPTFEYVGSGNFIFSGAGVYSIGFVFTGEGSLIYSGEATQIHSRYYLYTGSGELTYSGAAIVTISFAYVGSGTYNFSGVGLYSLGLLYAGSGVFNYSGGAVLRWGDWAEITKEISNFTEVDKGTSDLSKVEKGESNWKKTVKL